jgi:hypothetical protein
LRLPEDEPFLISRSISHDRPMRPPCLHQLRRRAFRSDRRPRHPQTSVSPSRAVTTTVPQFSNVGKRIRSSSAFATPASGPRATIWLIGFDMWFQSRRCRRPNRRPQSGRLVPPRAKRLRRPLPWKAAFAHSSEIDGDPVWQQPKAESKSLACALGGHRQAFGSSASR